MKTKNIFVPAIAAAALSLPMSGCMDEVSPANNVTPEQLEGMTSAQAAMLSGIVAYTNEKNIFEYTSGYYASYTNDFGYPCQMYFRDVLTADFPIAATATYNYWSFEENGSDYGSSVFTYYYYYHFIKNCNNLISIIDPEAAAQTSLNYLGSALAFRAMCYLDLARMFEYQETGYSSLDSKAEENGVMGLTVPISTEKTTEEEMTQNPRVPFYTMYRFILTDLNDAVDYLDGYSRPNNNYADLSVAKGLLARLWLEMATRFDKTPADLDTQLAHESDEDGYDKLGVTTANECYAQAAKYASEAMEGYTPMTQEEWTDPETGFNTEVETSWMLDMSISTTEQIGYYYSSFTGSICTEAEWAMPQYGNGYREICSTLYERMGGGDWRKASWISPDDAGKAPAAKYQTVSDEETFKKFPAYANLKFRARDTEDLYKGMLCDIPMMRVEEMYFIEAEATAHTSGVAAGVVKLNDFMNSYRYTNGSYNCTAESMDDFIDELIAQKRIEFWGEGLSFFDYKRLKMQIKRSDTNYGDIYQLDSKKGYVCPGMNYYIPRSAQNANQAIVLNPDCSGWAK